MWQAMALTLICATLSVSQGPAPPPERFWSPTDSVRAAVTDLRTLPEGVRYYTRYLDLGPFGVKDRTELIQVLSGHLNSLSSEPDLVAPVVVAGTSGALLRVNLLDYGWKERRHIWERLADADPYYQINLTGSDDLNWAGGTWNDGLHYDHGAFRWKRPKRALAPWLSEGPGGQQALAELVALAGSSRAPIVRGDWFLWQTVIQENRVPGYADFLGIGNQKQFESLVRFDGKLAAKLEQRRVVVFSGIALQPRRVERTHTVLGGLWRTFDVELAQGKSNPLRVLDNEFEFNATRQFAPLPNGLPVWWLANNKGVRQSKAPDQIVGGDRFGGGNDTRLHLGLSCWRCHFSGKEEMGIKPLDAVPIRKIAALDYEKFVELRRQYLRDVNPLIAIDRAMYASAVLKATGGMEPQAYAAALQRWYGYRDDARVDLAWAARDIGMSAAVFKLKLQAVDATGTLDPVLGLLMNGGAVPVRMWEECIPLAQIAARGYVLPRTARVR